jgi:hypothetical protein
MNAAPLENNKSPTLVVAAAAAALASWESRTSSKASIGSVMRCANGVGISDSGVLHDMMVNENTNTNKNYR